MANKVSDMQYNNKKKRQESEIQPDILEYGDIYFFYRPKVGSQEIKGIDDVRRFFMVTAPEETTTNTHRSDEKKKTHSNYYRLFVIGKKSLPEIRKSEARSSERFWARVGGIFERPEDLTKELLSDEFRKGDLARPVGEEKYASYIVTVINPIKPVPEGYPSADQSPQYPESVQQEFNENEDFVPLTRNLDLINYQNAQIILIGAREGKDVIKKEIGIDIVEEPETEKSPDIFSKLKVRKEQIPVRPLLEGRLE